MFINSLNKLNYNNSISESKSNNISISSSNSYTNAKDSLNNPSNPFIIAQNNILKKNKNSYLNNKKENISEMEENKIKTKKANDPLYFYYIVNGLEYALIHLVQLQLNIKKILKNLLLMKYSIYHMNNTHILSLT